MKLSELAALTGSRLEAPAPDIDISGTATLDDAGEGHITFLSNRRYVSRVKDTQASAIFVSEDEVIDRDIAVLRAKDPYLAYTRAMRLFNPERRAPPFRHPSAVIDASANVPADASIGPHTVIGPRVQIGTGVRIHPNVTIYEDVVIGNDCVIHSGVSIREGTEIGDRVVIYNNAVLGSDGFGYAKDEESRWLKIPQIGKVVIEDDVEIGAGTTIDRSSVGSTRIHRGAKIDNLVQIGHSCTVDEDALICAQVGLAGSSRIGKRVILTGQVGIGGHLTVGDDAMLYPQSGVPTNVEPGQVLCGSPAMDNRAFWRSIAVFQKLGDLPRRLRAIEKRLDEVTRRDE
jgi:UDP-3-O-[3-hydroxymyristoyl] glucosamine N-acyltransferase